MTMIIFGFIKQISQILFNITNKYNYKWLLLTSYYWIDNVWESIYWYICFMSYV